MATSRAAPPLAAYVLHAYDWSESSLVVELFTRAQGRLVAVARGAKKPTSNFRPVLLPFHRLTVWLSRAPADEAAEVRNLRLVEWGGGAPLPAAALMSGFYLNELVLKGLARQDPHPGLFDAYADTLEALAAPAADEAVALRAFELALLRELGLLPDLDAVTHTAEALQPGRGYTLHADSGLVPAAGGLGAPAWIALQAALQHGSAAALRQACAPVAAALRTPLRALVHYHLAPSPLRTRQVGLSMQRLAPPASR